MEQSERYLHVRELTGRNDHPDIQKMWGLINPVYYRTRPPWCAAYVYFAFRQAGLRPPVKTPALAASWYRKDLEVWRYNPHGNNRREKDPPLGSVVLYRLYTGGVSRIAHVGILVALPDRPGGAFIVNEGNTSSAGAVGQLTERDREGNGAYKKRRSAKSIEAMVDWIPIAVPVP